MYSCKLKIKLWYFIAALSRERHEISNYRLIDCFNSLFRQTRKRYTKAPHWCALWEEFTVDRWSLIWKASNHYTDVIMTTMTTMASQITSLAVVYSTVYSDADQRKHQSSTSLAFVWGIHRDRWIPRTKDQLRRKCFHLMTSSWCRKRYCIIKPSCFYLFLCMFKPLAATYAYRSGRLI